MNRRLLFLVHCWLFFACVSVATTAAAHPPGMPTPPSVIIYTSHSDSLSCVIPFSRAGNLMVVKAKVDTLEGNFIFDTGAPYLVLNLTYFRDYPVTVVPHSEQSSIAGYQATQNRTQVKELVFGELRQYRVDADLANLGNIENARGIKVLGLLGFELFRHCEMVIDFEKNLIYLHRVEKKKTLLHQHDFFLDTAAYNTYPIEITNNRIMATTEVAGKKVKLVVDCAAESNILDSRLPNKIFEGVTVTRRVKLTGPGDAKVDALYGSLSHLKMGSREWNDLPVLIINLAYTCFSDTDYANGVLGFDFLSRHKIGFNFVKNKMYLWK